MAFIPVPNTAQAELIYIWQDQVVENVLYFTTGAPMTPVMLQMIASDLKAWWIADIQDLQGVDIALREIKVTDLETESSPVFTLTSGLPLNGNVASEPMPGNVSLCVSFRSAGRGRSSRGRNYFPGLTENQVQGNIVTSGVITSLLTAYGRLQTGDAMFDSQAGWVVVSRFHNKAPRAIGLAQPVTSVVIIDPFVDSQRRRLPSRGR